MEFFEMQSKGIANGGTITYRCQYASTSRNVCHNLCYPPRSIILDKILDKFIGIRSTPIQKGSAVFICVGFPALIQKQAQLQLAIVPTCVRRCKSNVHADKVTPSSGIQREQAPNSDDWSH